MPRSLDRCERLRETAPGMELTERSPTTAPPRARARSRGAARAAGSHRGDRALDGALRDHSSEGADRARLFFFSRDDRRDRGGDRGGDGSAVAGLVGHVAGSTGQRARRAAPIARRRRVRRLRIDRFARAGNLRTMSFLSRDRGDLIGAVVLIARSWRCAGPRHRSTRFDPRSVNRSVMGPARFVAIVRTGIPLAVPSAIRVIGGEFMFARWGDALRAAGLLSRDRAFSASRWAGRAALEPDPRAWPTVRMAGSRMGRS